MAGKILLVVTALIELPAGLALVAAPDRAGQLLLGDSLESAAARVVARVAGVALLGAGVACWLARKGDRASQVGPVAGMLVYNAGVPLILAQAWLAWSLDGLGLWPACGLHAVMAGWCAMWLWRGR